jgi:hypothetical protein
MTVEETAEALSVSPATVKRVVDRARTVEPRAARVTPPDPREPMAPSRWLEIQEILPTRSRAGGGA